MTNTFEKVYGSAAGVRVFRGPGRVNLIGEHTDYNLGFVLPMALDMACLVAAGPGSDGKLRVYSANLNQSAEFDVAAVLEWKPAKAWTDYVCGVAVEIAKRGLKLAATNLAINSSVPVGSGLSSSAALEVSTALALLGDQNIDKLELVKLCRAAENNFVGMPCGIMDQYISVFGREHAAIQIDCRSLDHYVAELPRDIEILAVNSMVKHELGASAYGQRVRECATAVEIIKRRLPAVSSLRDLSVPQFDELKDDIPEPARKRARHVVTEDARVEDFVTASRRGDLVSMGQLFVASHRSLQYDYEVSCEELDYLVDTALEIAGVYGARMTGGGFGGCTVNLVDPRQAGAFTEQITEGYERRFGLTPLIYHCKPSAGAGEVL